jgi:antitoxin (DNA-binding transcriptional repressor) of toxin-antitoxin stability system
MHVNVYAARTHLSRLIGQVNAGEEIIITPDAAVRAREHARFIDDLRQVAELVPAVRLAA